MTTTKYPAIEKKMNATEINKIPIWEFLSSISIEPERKFNGYWIYKSFINTQQNTGSLKVSKNNLWVDFSANNRGGTLIDLILLIYPELTVSDVIRRFNQGDFSFHQLPPLQRESDGNTQAPIEIIQEEDIVNHPTLCRFLSSDRGIDIRMAARYLKAYQYKVNGKLFWNLGTRNHLDGYNLFSKGFKCATKQGVTLFTHLHSKGRVFFEGIVDFLSFLMIYPDQEQLYDYCILNSVNNLKKSLEIHPLMPITIGFLDRDRAGDRATYLLKTESLRQHSKFYDYRSTFQGKDLNDYLLGKY